METHMDITRIIIRHLTFSLLMLKRQRSLSSHPPNNLMGSKSRPSICSHSQRLLSCSRIATAVYMVNLHSVTFPVWSFLEEWGWEGRGDKEEETTCQKRSSYTRTKCKVIFIESFFFLHVFFSFSLNPISLWLIGHSVLSLTFPREPNSIVYFFQVIWRTIHFSVWAKWAMAGSQLWTTAALFCCTLQHRHHAAIGLCEEGKSKTKRFLLFEEVSISSQGVERLYIEIQPSCFSLLIHSAVQKQTPLWWSAVAKPNAGGMWRNGETQDGDKRRHDEKKEGEKQFPRTHTWRCKERRGEKVKERTKTWRPTDVSLMNPSAHIRSIMC